MTPTTKHHLHTFLGWTASVIDTEGLVLRNVARRAGMKPTYQRVLELLTEPPENYSKELREAWEFRRAEREPTKEHYTEGRAAIRWAHRLPHKVLTSDSFMSNLHAVSKRYWVDKGNAGLAVALLVAYRNQKGEL
jgi:hypothetical protein